MRNVRVLCNHGRALLAHQCTFDEKIARVSISRFKWLHTFSNYKCWVIKLKLNKKNWFSSLNHSYIVKILPFLWWFLPWQPKCPANHCMIFLSPMFDGTAMQLCSYGICDICVRPLIGIKQWRGTTCNEFEGPSWTVTGKCFPKGQCLLDCLIIL